MANDGPGKINSRITGTFCHRRRRRRLQRHRWCWWCWKNVPKRALPEWRLLLPPGENGVSRTRRYRNEPKPQHTHAHTHTYTRNADFSAPLHTRAHDDGSWLARTDGGKKIEPGTQPNRKASENQRKQRTIAQWANGGKMVSHSQLHFSTAPRNR